MIFEPDPTRHESGTSVAPKAARAFAFCDREFGTDFGRLEAARECR